MQNKKTFTWFVGMAVLFFYCVPVFAVEFAADMTEYIEDQTKTSKMYVKDSKYRIEQEEEGQQIIVIVDQDENITRVLTIEEKIYMEMASDDPLSLMNDPFQSVKYSNSIGESEHLGIDTVSGYECDKYLITYEGMDLMTQWVSQTLNFPIKIETHGEEKRSMELSNFQEVPIGDALFKIPEDYRKIEKSGYK